MKFIFLYIMVGVITSCSPLPITGNPSKSTSTQGTTGSSQMTIEMPVKPPVDPKRDPDTTGRRNLIP